MNFITVAELNKDIINNLYKIPRDIDVVVGVPRSGMLAATLIALYLNKPLSDLDSFGEKRLYSLGMSKNVSGCVTQFDKVRKALVIEDSSSTGRSIKRAKEKLKEVEQYIECIYMAAYVCKETESMVDISFRKVEQPRVFEWNFMQHGFLKTACVDIDGVLCIDPSSEENDDGEKYRKFIREAKPKYIPTAEIGWIVTSRLEKYRENTEEWLQRQGIIYDHLYMMNVESAEKRRRLGNHAKFKAEIFKNAKGAMWFIESEKEQAEEIAKLTGKAVFCVGSERFFKDSWRHRLPWSFRWKIPLFLKKVLPKSVVEKLKNIKRYSQAPGYKNDGSGVGGKG